MMERLDRILIDPAVMMGQPVIRGTRLPVYVVLEAIAAGDSRDDLLAAFPFLEPADIDQALAYAAEVSRIGLEVA